MTQILKHRIAFLAASAGMLLLGALVYFPGLPGDFVFDDIGSIVNNDALRSGLTGTGGLLQTILSAPVGGLLRPFSTLTFLLDSWAFGISPGAFKLTNIFIHLCAGTTLWFVARDLLRAYVRRSRLGLDEHSIAWLALTATGLWLVHPLNLTSVLYTVQRDNALAACFSGGAMLAYLTGRRREKETGAGAALMMLATPLLVLLGMLCKENAALTPLLLLAAEFTLLGFAGKDDMPSQRVRWFFGIFLLLPFLAACTLLYLKPAFFLAAYDVRPFTMAQRLLTECRVLMDYLRWTFVPDLRELGLFHDDIAISQSLVDPPTTLPAVAAVLGLLTGAFLGRKRFPLLSLGILWFFAGQLMESSILPLELVFEHRNYLPIFGVILGCVGTLYPASGDPMHERLAKIGFTAVVCLMAVITGLRAHDWRSELSFARTEALHHPGSARAQAEMEWAYMAYILSSRDLSLIPLAVEAAERSKKDDPGSINQDVGLAYMYAKLQDLPKAQTRLRTAAARAPTALATSTLQLALQSLLQLTDKEMQPLYPDTDAVFRDVLADPAVARNACFHGETWNTYAVFLEVTQEIPQALEAFHKAATLCPSHALIHANYADMLLRFGDIHDAKTEIDALDAQHDLRYLLESRRLHAEYARLIATAAHP
ncbi:MAG: tetratricopeptide repeat protein [Bacillota bacterium]